MAHKCEAFTDQWIEAWCVCGESVLVKGDRRHARERLARIHSKRKPDRPPKILEGF